MRTLLLLLGSCLLTTLLSAQYFDGGVQVGMAHYSGDLSNQQINLAETGSMIGFFGRYNYSEHLAFRASLSRAMISGSDANTNLMDLRMRNLSFRSEVIELAATVEYNLLKFNIPAEQTSTPYLFAGIAAYHFNPQAQYEGQWYDLRPLGTEGQLLEDGEAGYSRVQVAVPFGVGFKFALGLRANLGFQLGVRKLFTDYLDDVSTTYPDLEQLRNGNPLAGRLSYRSLETNPVNPVGQERGNPLNNDSYLFSTINLSVNLTNRYGLDFEEKYEIFKPRWNDPEMLRQKEARDARKAELAAAKDARKQKAISRDAAKAAQQAERQRQRLVNEQEAADQAHLLSEEQLAERDRREELAATKATAQREQAAMRARKALLREQRQAAVKQRRSAIREAKQTAKQQQRAIKLEDPAKAAKHAAREAKKAERAAEQLRQQKINEKRRVIEQKRKEAKRRAKERLRALRDHKVTSDDGKIEAPVKQKTKKTTRQR